MITLPLPPPLNAMYRTRFGGRGVYKTDKCKDWEYGAQLECRRLGVRMADRKVAVRMTVDMYLARDRDIDSSLKALLDCLQGVAYERDSQITSLTVRKFRDGDRPRVEVDLFPA